LAADDDEAAERHLRRALELVDETDSPIWQSDVRLGVARAFARSHREEAIELAREASELAQGKGLLVFVERARALLEELGASSERR
jgi:hypothetical protein